MANQVPWLRGLDVDIFLSSSMMQVWERYVSSAIGDTCFRVCFATSTTHVLNNPIAYGLLNRPAPTLAANAGPAAIRPTGLVRRILRRFAEAVTWRDRTRLAVHYGKVVITYAYGRLAFSGRLVLERSVIPALLSGKTFPFEKYDQLTQLGTNQFDAGLFFDPQEARAHAALFDNPNMFTVEHPAHGSCRCRDRAIEPRPLLVILSGQLAGDLLAESMVQHIVESYARDIVRSVRESGATEVHLRLHPRETSMVRAQRLVDYLALCGVEARIVDPVRPVREIVCDYVGVLGFASSALRDARAACDYAFVVCLMGVSRTDVADPKTWLGDAEGIDWVEEDGTFPPGAFQRRLHVLPPHPSVPELLRTLLPDKRQTRGAARLVEPTAFTF